MGKNIISGDLEKGFAHGPKELWVDKKKKEEEAYRAGRNLGYHPGYGLGFESGYEKGYAEGSTLGYNNGFLTALGLGEGCCPADPGEVTETHICQALQKLIARGQAHLFLSGCAARGAEALLKMIDINATVVKKGSKV